MFKEGAITKEEFFKFSKEVDNRLARIEYHLSEPTGETRERKIRIAFRNFWGICKTSSYRW